MLCQFQVYSKVSYLYVYIYLSSLMTQRLKNLPAVQETQETWVQSLGQEDTLEKEMANHSSILAGKTPWTEEPGYSPKSRKESEATKHVCMGCGPSSYPLIPPIPFPCSRETKMNKGWTFLSGCSSLMV